jgi:hypothetical protein
LIFKHLGIFVVIAAVVVTVAPAAGTMGAKHRFVSTVISTNPIAYFRLESTQGKSEVGAATYSSVGGVTASQSCAPIDVRNNGCVALNGTDAYVKTTQLAASAAPRASWLGLI